MYMYIREKGSINGHAGSPYYIGKGHGRRAFNKHSNVPLPKDRGRIIVVYENLSEAEANMEEKRLIMVYGRIDKGTGCLRNRTDGGEGQCGIQYTPEWRAKISRSLIGVPKPLNARQRGPRSPEISKAMSEGQKARHARCPVSQETRTKRSESLRKAFAEGRIRRTSEQARINALKAGPPSAETRRKIGEASRIRMLAYHARKRAL